MSAYHNKGFSGLCYSGVSRRENQKFWHPNETRRFKVQLCESYQIPSLSNNVAMRIASCSLSVNDMSSSCIFFAKIDLLKHDGDGMRGVVKYLFWRDTPHVGTSVPCARLTPFRQPISIRRIGHQTHGSEPPIRLIHRILVHENHTSNLGWTSVSR